MGQTVVDQQHVGLSKFGVSLADVHPLIWSRLVGAHHVVCSHKTGPSLWEQTIEAALILVLCSVPVQLTLGLLCYQHD